MNNEEHTEPCIIWKFNNVDKDNYSQNFDKTYKIMVNNKKQLQCRINMCLQKF